VRSLKNLSQYDTIVLKQSTAYGGFHNAHAHPCRGYTLPDVYLEHAGTTPLKASNLPLEVKQNLVGDLHKGLAYTPSDLRKRMTMLFERQIAFGVRRIDCNIDATPDLPEHGMLAINIVLELKKKFAKKGLEIRFAPTPIFGFQKRYGAI
jgi:hypothetical protein